VATFAELGVNGVEVDLWYAFFAPSKTPSATVNRLNLEMTAILKTTEVTELFKRAGMDAATSSTDELAQLVGKDFPRWGEVIRKNGITAD
jgi:tripartite-type tricarboxylate transporter receptor subunit TctC